MKEINHNGIKSQTNITNKYTSSEIQKISGPTYGSLAQDSLFKRFDKLASIIDVIGKRK